MWIIEKKEIWQSIIDQDEQMEFDWLGIDKIGQIAIFSNFNSGYTPKCITNSMNLYNELVNFIEGLEKISETVKVTSRKGRYDDWEEYAQKGIFGYDNENIHSGNNPNRYHLIYKPTSPFNYNNNSNLKNSKR